MEEKDALILDAEKRLNDLENKFKANIDNMENKIKSLEINIKKHEKNKDKKNFKCKECDFGAGSEQGLKTHITRKHNAEIKKKEQLQFPRTCDLCDYEFDSIRDMKQHIKTHSYKKCEYKCEECDFCGTNKITMEVHLGKMHSENFECGLCDNVVKDFESLELHLFTCEMFKCCGEKFKCFSDLKSHIKNDHKEDTFIQVQHAKLKRENKEEVSCKTLWKEDVFPDED